MAPLHWLIRQACSLLPLQRQVKVTKIRLRQPLQCNKGIQFSRQPSKETYRRLSAPWIKLFMSCGLSNPNATRHKQLNSWCRQTAICFLQKFERWCNIFVPLNRCRTVTVLSHASEQKQDSHGALSCFWIDVGLLRCSLMLLNKCRLSRYFSMLLNKCRAVTVLFHASEQLRDSYGAPSCFWIVAESHGALSCFWTNAGLLLCSLMLLNSCRTVTVLFDASE